MKKTLLIAFFALFQLVSLHSKAQAPTIDDPMTVKERYAGYQLMLASKHFYTGTIIFGAGSIVYALGQVSFNSSGGKDGAGLVVLGALAELTGAVFIIESYSHIGKAGRMLSGPPKKLSMGGTNSGGFGLKFDF